MASLSQSLWRRNRVLAEAALEHLFVQGIASGAWGARRVPVVLSRLGGR